MSKEDKDDKKKLPKGAFNKAVEFLFHLQRLEGVCDTAAINNDFHTWFHTLQAWFNKLCGKLDKERIDDITSDFENVETYIYSGIPDQIKKQQLNMIQRKIEKIMDEFNYQMPDFDADDDEDYYENLTAT